MKIYNNTGNVRINFNIEALSCNNCCTGKAKNFTNSENVCVALGI